MKPADDLHTAKRPVNLSLNEDLVTQAREATKLRHSATAWNAFSEQHGTVAGACSTL